MNTKIKMFSVGAMMVASFFASASFVSAQTATVASCTSATLNGTVTDTSGVSTSAWFEWGTTSSFGNTTAHQVFSVPQDFSQIISGLTPSTTYYFRVVGSNIYGSGQGGTLTFSTPACPTQNYNNNSNFSQPYVSTNSASSVSTNTATLNGYVTSNGTNTSAWFEWGTSYSFGNTTSYNSYGTGSTSFNSALYNLNPNTTYYYRAVAQSSYGTIYGSTLSFTTSGQTYNYNYNTYTGSAPTVTTLLATELTGATAKLNGLVFTSENVSSNAWYEWGTTASLGNKTQTINVGALSVVKHSDFISGLTKGQTYYYRLVGQNSYGTSYGAVNSFVSEVNTYVAPVVSTSVVLKPTTTVVTRGGSLASPVMLTIEGGAEMIGSGEKRTYRVTWKNQSGQTLKNVVLRVTFPKIMKVDSATRGAFSSADNSVVVDLKTLAGGESGDTFIFATTGRGIKAGEVLVVTANMVYTGANGVQGDAVAYVMHRGEGAQSALGASVLGAGEFVPTTLFGWMLLLILTLVLVLLGNHLYGRLSGAGAGHH